MKVDNKNGIGNPYHDDNTGEFSSADGNSIKNNNENIKTSYEQSFIDALEPVEKVIKQNYNSYTSEAKETADIQLEIINEARKKLFDKNSMLSEDFNRKYFGNILGEKTEIKTLDYALKQANPYYITGKEEYRYNCINTVYAYDLLRKGYNVEALPKEKGKVIPREWEHIYADQEWTNQGELGNTIEEVKNNLKNKMKEYGSGARAILYVVWKSQKEAHAMCIENNDEGKIVLLDTQSGQSWNIDDDISWLWNNIIPKETIISRIDNLDVVYSKDIKKMIKKKGE